MGWFASGFRICAIALVAVAGGVLAAPAAAAPPNPAPEELWERFPLDDRRDEPRPGGATPGRGVKDEPLRTNERAAPTAERGDSESSTPTELVLLAAIVLLGLGAALVVSGPGPRLLHKRKPALHTGSSAGAAVVEPLVGAAPAAPASVTTSGGSTKEHRPADEPEQRPPILAPDALLGPLRMVAEYSRARGASEPLTVAPTKEEGGHVAEIDVLKAKLGAHGSKQANGRADAEVELLKRKSATGAAAVKTKHPKAPIDNERLAPRDTLALKEKLGDPDLPSVRVVEARADNWPAERATTGGARLIPSARPEAWWASEWLRDHYIVIGWAAFLIAAAVTLGVSAAYLVLLMY